MGREIDLSGLMYGLMGMRAAGKPKDAGFVMCAMERLRATQLPEAYLDGIQDELLQMVCAPIPKSALVSVYLAFHGTDDRASYMKIGVARNVRARMSGLSTGNPLPRLWTYAASFAGRHRAVKVEGALLSHMGNDRVKGEWIRVGGLSAEAAAAIVESLSEVAAAEMSQPVQFIRQEA